MEKLWNVLLYTSKKIYIYKRSHRKVIVLYLILFSIIKNKKKNKKILLNKKEAYGKK